MTAPESGDRRLDELLRIASGGNREAMAMVFERYRPRLERMVDLRLDIRHRAHFDVQDLLQETYLEASRRLEEFLRERKVPFYLWLRMLAFQKVIEVNRRHNARKRGAGMVRRFPSGPSTSGGGPASTGAFWQGTEASPSGAAIRDEMHEKLDEVLRGLEPPDREVLLLRYFELLTNAEAAQVLGVPENTASQRHLRALRKLKKALEGRPELASFFGFPGGPTRERSPASPGDS